jgi:hypothetical protein
VGVPGPAGLNQMNCEDPSEGRSLQVRSGMEHARVPVHGGNQVAHGLIASSNRRSTVASLTVRASAQTWGPFSRWKLQPYRRSARRGSPLTTTSVPPHSPHWRTPENSDARPDGLEAIRPARRPLDLG